jgi:hypothetical protein
VRELQPAQRSPARLGQRAGKRNDEVHEGHYPGAPGTLG